MIRKLLPENIRFLLYLILFSIGFNFISFAQTNACNNNAGGEITVGSSCNPTTMNVDSDNDYWNGASGCNSGDYDDEWAWFTAISNSTTITYTPDSGDAILHLFDSACSPTMTSIDCSDSGLGGDPETITYATTIGQVYRIRVQRWLSNTTLNGTICIYDSTPPTCPGTTTNFYDTGGAGGDYGNNETLTWTFYPDGGPVTATFSAFDLENNWDFLNVYDGPDNGSPLIGSYTGNTIPGPFTSTHATGTLTFEFLSDGTVPNPGWEASICGSTVPACTDDPINITANSTTPTTATVSWTHPSPQPGNGYEYIISTDNTTGTPGDDMTGTTAGNSINLTGLTPGTTYYVFVRGDCGGGDLGIWITTVFTTGCTNTVTTRTVCPIIVDEATNNPFIADPFVDDPTAQLDCDNGDVTLAAHANLRETTSYIVEKTAYPSPAPDYDFPVLSGSPQNITTDDTWAPARTNLGFDFSFFNQCYTQTLAGANGVITFDSSVTPGSWCEWSFNTGIPDGTNLFEQTIFGVYHDIDIRNLPNDAIRSRTIGTVPCRQFQISWNDIPMYGDATRFYTGMIILHETTNIIEVFIEEKRIENGDVLPWNDGNAIVGIQGDVSNGEWAVAPCRNGLDTNWETANEAWRFVPNGAVINPNTVTWYQGSVAPGNILTANIDDTVTVSSANTYIAVTDYTICGNSVTLTDDIIVSDSRKIWNGSVDTDWYTAANWTPNGIPTNLDCIVVPDVTTTFNRSPIVIGGPPTPPLPGEGRSLRVESNGYVELEQDANLIITDAIYIENTMVPNGKVILRSGSNLVQRTNTGITNTGNIQMQRSVSGLTPQDYVYWSSPVNGFDVNDVSPGSSLIYKWIPTIGGNGAGNYGNWQATGEPMQTGVGYIIQGVSGTSPETTVAANTVEFIGTPKNGAYSVPILRGSYNGVDYTGAGGTMATALDDNWNLIGNPYPSAIFADEFITQNADLDDTADPNTPAIFGTVYLWRHQTAPSTIADPFYGDFVYNYNPNDYIGYNSTGSNPAGFNGYIGSGQAFFVLMDHNATTPSNVVFNNDMRLDAGAPVDNNQFYRTHERNNRSNYEKHRIWLDLITPSNTANSILVGYIENATNQFDRLYDGFELSETSTRFYSINDNNDLAIQGRTLPFDDTDLVPLGVEIPVAGNYSIAINTLDGLFENEEQNIYLEDTYNNFIHDLRLSPYSFNTEAGEFNDRFILRYTNESLSVDEFDSSASITITAPNNDYILAKSGVSPIKTIVIYDVLGRILYSNNSINELEFRIDKVSQSDGVLFVKATLDNGNQKIQKVILKH